MAKKYDYLYKLLLIGDSGVGKSCVLLRFSDDRFTETLIATVGIDFKLRTIDLDGLEIKLQIWDTTGEARFFGLNKKYFTGAMGIMLVYDITDKNSFENIKNWIRAIEENGFSVVEKMLLGNKCDLEGQRQISKEKGQQLAVEYGIKFIETSAKDSIGVEEAFFTLTRDVKANREKNLEASNSPQGGHRLGAYEPERKPARCTLL